MIAWDLASAVDTDATDRRSHDRIALEIEVTLESESQFFAGLTGDVSTGGVFVSTYCTLPIGARVWLELALPTGVVRVRGVVRWLREASSGASPGIGIAFERVSLADFAAVRELCAHRSPLYYDEE